MPNITKANYPTEDGWLHVGLELKPEATMSEDKMAAFMAFTMDGFKADLTHFETHVGTQDGLNIKGVIRRKETAAA